MGLWSRSPLPPRSRSPAYQSGNDSASRTRYGANAARAAFIAPGSGGEASVEVAGPRVARELGPEGGTEAAAVARGRVRLDRDHAPHARDHGGDRVVAQAEAQRQLGQGPGLAPHDLLQR